MGYYLVDNPPVRSQGRARRAAASGGVVVHTAEASADLVPPDLTAEHVANYIVHRSTPGSYHTIFDSDSTVRLWNYETTEAYHDGTGTNRFSTGISFATHAASWGEARGWDNAALDQAAVWLAETYIPTMKARGVDVRLERTTVERFRNGDPAFVAHGDLDPGRRSDPGASFPWQRLFDKTTALLAPAPTPPTKPPPTKRSKRMPYLFGKYTKHATIFAFFPHGDVRAMGPSELAYYRRVNPKTPIVTTSSKAEYTAWRRASRQ